MFKFKRMMFHLSPEFTLFRSEKRHTNLPSPQQEHGKLGKNDINDWNSIQFIAFVSYTVTSAKKGVKTPTSVGISLTICTLQWFESCPPFSICCQTYEEFEYWRSENFIRMLSQPFSENRVHTSGPLNPFICQNHNRYWMQHFILWFIYGRRRCLPHQEKSAALS